jgi:SCY1-like protein 2
MHVQPFNIPNLRIEQRKTSSAEDMARKNSTGAYFVAVAVALVALVTSFSCIF